MRAGALLLLGLGLLAAPAAGQVGRTEVKEVRFAGNRAFPSDSLARAIVTRPTQCRSEILVPLCWAGASFAIQRFYLDRQELRLDSLRLKVWYQRRGFRDVDVSYRTTPLEDSAAAVTFRIREGRPVLVDSVLTVGTEGLAGTGVLGNLPLKRGDRLNTILLDATRDTLTARLADRGYARAVVLRDYFIPADHPYRAEVTFAVTRGPLAHYGPITVVGNESLSRTTVLRTLRFHAGDLYRLDQLQEAQARLFGLGIVRSAQVQPELTSGSDSVIPVKVTLQEGKVHRVRAGAGWTDDECFNVDARWTSRNFLGGGRQLQVRGRVSNLLTSGFRELLCPQSGSGDFADPTWLASVDFSQPWIFSTRNAFSASLFDQRESVPNIFVRQAVGLTLNLTRALGPHSAVTLSYRPERDSLSAAQVLLCTSFLVCTPRDVSILEGANWLAPIGLDFTETQTNNVLNPSRGHSVIVDFEHADTWTGSDFRYDRVLMDGAQYTTLFDHTILATRIELGWVGNGEFRGLSGSTSGGADIIHPQKRFYAGGANSVRGFAQYRLGPRVLQVDAANLLQPVDSGGAGCSPEQVMALTCNASSVASGRFTPRATGGTRLFVANVEVRFPLSSRFQGVTFTDFGQVWGEHEAVSLKSIQATPGFGVRYMSAIGPIRVDLAYRFRGGQDLSVVTTRIREYDASTDKPSDQIVVDGVRIPYVRTQDLAVLGPQVFYGASPALSLSRFQLHFSIGQAF